MVGARILDGARTTAMALTATMSGFLGKKPFGSPAAGACISGRPIADGNCSRTPLLGWLLHGYWRGEEMSARIAAAFVALAVLAGGTAASAGPALLFNASDGTVLYAEDQDDPWHPASLTKMMTAYVTFAAIKNGELALQTE